MLTFIRTCAALGFALWFIPAGLGRLTLPGQQTALRIAAGGALGLVVFELLTLPFHAAGASFRVMVALWCALCGAGAAAGFWRQRRRPAPPRRPLRPDAAELLLAAVVVLAVAAVTLNTVLNTTYKNWDDQTYCANAVITWQTDVINRHTFYSGRYVQAFYLPEYTIASWPIFSALLAVLSGLHPAVIYRTLLPLFEIPAAFAIIWLLARRFFPASRKKAWLVLLYYLLFTLAAAEQIGTVSSEWWLVVNCWTGKALAFHIVVPLVLWLLFLLEDTPDPARRRAVWAALFFVCAASCVVAATMFVILPVELGLWGLFYLWRTRRWGEIRQFCLCAAPAVLCALVTL